MPKYLEDLSGLSELHASINLDDVSTKIYNYCSFDFCKLRLKRVIFHSLPSMHSDLGSCVDRVNKH